ncbi:hypothetical protein P7K49_037048 [Saguinus oedipus]|uniref:Uncharacterized protein n=1 Tax=Saguinus oedipus TaxID=9490 RepID=A0ABQ9TMV6_SAGOE|nr:hypothetical protein P7K49_037048 [Saguinus oedipus]
MGEALCDEPELPHRRLLVHIPVCGRFHLQRRLPRGPPHTLSSHSGADPALSVEKQVTASTEKAVGQTLSVSVSPPGSASRNCTQAASTANVQTPSQAYQMSPLLHK